jgi:periplasmic divalent cation tolerance protein
VLESTSSARVVMTTAANAEEAARLGRVLVEERLVACATLLPGVHSIYRWKENVTGKANIESSEECMLLLKTALHRLPALEARLHELHGYETPEFLVLTVEGGSRAYLAWLADSVDDGTTGFLTA